MTGFTKIMGSYQIGKIEASKPWWAPLVEPRSSLSAPVGSVLNEPLDFSVDGGCDRTYVRCTGVNPPYFTNSTTGCIASIASIVFGKTSHRISANPISPSASRDSAI